MGIGIDYGNGIVNIDRVTGIRHGVIHQGAILQAWADSSEASYGDPTCPKCGGEVLDAATTKNNYPPLYSYGCTDYECEECRVTLDSGDVFGEEPLFYAYDGDGYMCEQRGDDCDIFILQSPYYTRAAYCSPCAPGACYITSPCEDGDRAYCFGHDWFEEGRAPYPVYRVEDDALVAPEANEGDNDLCG